MTTEQETNLRETLKTTYPATEPSDALQRRISALAAETAASASSRQSRHLRVGLRLAGGAAIALIILMLIFGSHSNAVYAFQHIADSLQLWRGRLSKGVAAQKIAPLIYYQGHPVRAVIRDFQVNTKGDVFLLFTANTEVGRDIPFGTADLTDEFGTKYLDPSRENGGIGSQTFLPTCFDPTQNGPKIKGYVFGNEQLEGIRWVPLQKQTPWKPRRFRLTLHLNHPAAGGPPSTVVFNLPVQKTQAEIVPAYMPYMARPLSSDPGIQAEEETAARAYSFYHEEHDLPQALVTYRELIAILSEHAKREKAPLACAEEWLEVYHILTDMGRMEEAKAALLHAKRDNDIRAFNPSTHDQIKAAMKELGMTP